MFFELHDEKIIAYKQLTDADLGRSINSHQTHIGLFGDVFTYLPNDFEVDECMLIYNNNLEFLSLNFNRIKNPDGTYRSPKIKSGTKNEISIVTFVRDRAKEYDKNVKWYLFWFGLKGGQPVFFLFNENSSTYNEMKALNIDLHDMVKNRLTAESRQFGYLLDYLEKIVNKTSTKYAEELEIIAQTNSGFPKKYREYDVRKAKANFEEIGQKGEALVNTYLFKLKQNGEIINYEWANKDGESGLPYDFYYETKTGEIIYLDVKSTNYKFSQRMLFSSQEIEFAISGENKYYIYRVYVNETGVNCLKICTNAKNLLLDIHYKTTVYENSLNNIAKLETAKLAILPTQNGLDFGHEILLPKTAVVN